VRQIGDGREAVGVIPRAVDWAILHVAVAANTVGLGVILSLLAEMQDAYGLPTGGLGLIAGASFATSFLAYLGLSRFADRGYAKAMLLAGSVFGSSALVLTAYGRDLWVLVFARAVLGLAEGVFVPAARRVVLDWSPDRPGEALGTVMAASVGGFLLGPVLGGLLAPRFGLEIPFLIPAALVAAALPVIARMRAPAPAPATSPSSYRTLLGSRFVLAGILFVAVDFLVFGVFDSVWARLLADSGASTGFVGLTFAVVAIPLLVLTRPLGKLVDRRSPQSVAVPGAMLVIRSDSIGLSTLAN
jgi:MFS family permease